GIEPSSLGKSFVDPEGGSSWLIRFPLGATSRPARTAAQVAGTSSRSHRPNTCRRALAAATDPTTPLPVATAWPIHRADGREEAAVRAGKPEPGLGLATLVTSVERVGDPARDRFAFAGSVAAQVDAAPDTTDVGADEDRPDPFSQGHILVA